MTHRHKYSDWILNVEDAPLCSIYTQAIYQPSPTIECRWWFRYCLECGTIAQKWKREIKVSDKRNIIISLERNNEK